MKPSQIQTTTDSSTRLIGAVLTAHQKLASYGPSPSVIADTLESVGRAAAVDRAYIFAFRRDVKGTVLASQRYEWSAESAAPQMKNPSLQDIPMREAGYGRWVDRLIAYLPVAGSVRSFPDTERRLLEEQDIRSLIVLPIYADAVIWGFVGFDDCSCERVWSDMEADLLLSVAIALGGVMPPGEHGGAHDRHTSNARISGYAAIAGGLVWADDDGGARHGGDLCGRTVETRMRTLVRTHQLLKSRSWEETIVLEHYLSDMENSFSLITSPLGITTSVHTADSAGTPVGLEMIPPIGMLIAERLLAIRPGGHDAASLDRLTIEVRAAGEHATILVRGFNIRNEPVPVSLEVSAARLLFERRLLSYTGGQVRGERSGLGSEVGTFPVARTEAHPPSSTHRLR